MCSPQIWFNSQLTFQNMSQNLYIMDIKTKIWRRLTIKDGDKEKLCRSMFMHTISGNK